MSGDKGTSFVGTLSGRFFKDRRTLEIGRTLDANRARLTLHRINNALLEFVTLLQWSQEHAEQRRMERQIYSKRSNLEFVLVPSPERHLRETEEEWGEILNSISRLECALVEARAEVEVAEFLKEAYNKEFSSWHSLFGDRALCHLAEVWIAYNSSVRDLEELLTGLLEGWASNGQNAKPDPESGFPIDAGLLLQLESLVEEIPRLRSVPAENRREGGFESLGGIDRPAPPACPVFDDASGGFSPNPRTPQTIVIDDAGQAVIIDGVDGEAAKFRIGRLFRAFKTLVISDAPLRSEDLEGYSRIGRTFKRSLSEHLKQYLGFQWGPNGGFFIRRPSKPL